MLTHVFASLISIGILMQFVVLENYILVEINRTCVRFKPESMIFFSDVHSTSLRAIRDEKSETLQSIVVFRFYMSNFV